MGIRDPIEVQSEEEKAAEAKKHFLLNLTRGPHGRYKVGLPWIENIPHLPTNKGLCEKRLTKVTIDLKNNKKINDYSDIFRSWVNEGIIEVVTEDDGKGHYLPHRPVYKENSTTTPIRPVFDASAKMSNSPSLNNCVYKGQNLIELIPSVLHRFRKKRLGFVADIRKAFQMVELKEEDRNFLKFLWWEGPEHTTPVVYRHTRVVFGVSSSPFQLAAVLDYHLNNEVNDEEKEVAEALWKFLYVDNVSGSVDEEEEFFEFQKMSIQIMSRAAMELRQWEHAMPEDPGVGLSMTNDGCGLGAGKGSACSTVLGLQWDKQNDTLSCDIPTFKADEIITKRVLLQRVSQVFDPMGFLSPALLQIKVLIQNAWKESKDWDVELDEETKRIYNIWDSESKLLEEVRIPRWTNYHHCYEIQFHLFTDACQYAYGAIIFLRVKLYGAVKLILLASKSRVAPIKQCTIPRLELMGALVGSRLLKSVKTELEEAESYQWTDSTTTLAWIKRVDNFAVFVARRREEIRNLTDINNWLFVPGTMKSADLYSRGCSPKEFLEKKGWEGPEWLIESEDSWPSQVPIDNEREIQQEVKKTVKVTAAAVKEEGWFSPKRPSTFTGMVKVMGWILRFINNVRVPYKFRVLDKEMNSEEIEEAEKKVFQVIQNEGLSDSLLKNQIHDLYVKKYDGVLRVKSKLTNDKRDENFRLPVLLPKDHPLVKLLIREVHEKCFHAGTQTTWCKLRERFWILQGRRQIKSILKSCTICKRFGGKPYKVVPGDLPEKRVNGGVFQTVGVDLAGPLFLKDGSKVWVVLYTCAVYRGVILDLVGSLSAEAFLRSLSRFISNYGRMSEIMSDNATNFVLSAKLLKRVEMEKLTEKMKLNSIKWTFSVPSAPWWGGWWEIMVKQMKGQLRKMLGSARLTEDELRTALAAVAATINDRPLTGISEDGDDLVPLTPAMFMHPSRNVLFPEQGEIGKLGLIKRFKMMTSITEKLRCRFRKEYLGLLVQRGKDPKTPKPKVGDVVLVGQDNKRRYEWPLGLITELIPGRDDEVRVAKLKTQKGELTRPLQRLHPLEVSSAAEIPSTTMKEDLIAKMPRVIYERGHEEMDKIESMMEQNEALEKATERVITRSGRRIKIPNRYVNAVSFL